MGSQAKSLANKLRLLLQARSADNYVYGQRQGKLVNSQLYRVPSNIKGLSDTVFKRKDVNKTLDVAIGVLVDMSGSMNGHKWTHASEALVLLNEALGNVLHLPILVAGFSTELTGMSEECKILVFREPMQASIPTNRLSDNLSKARYHAFANNQDGEAVLWMYSELLKTDAARKIMIVLSDGQPYCARGGDFVGYLKQVTSSIEQQRKVELYGVGILTDAPKNFYKNNIVINSSDEIESGLLKLLRKILVK